MGCDSMVGIATLRAERFAVRARWGQEIVSSPHTSRPVPEPTQPPVKWPSWPFPKGKAAGVWR